MLEERILREKDGESGEKKNLRRRIRIGGGGRRGGERRDSMRRGKKGGFGDGVEW